MTDYSAGYEFPRDLHDDAPASGTDHIWEPGTDNAVAHGCLCTNERSFPALGHLIATKCPVHMATWVSVPPADCDGCPDCGGDPEACGCAGNDRGGRV